MLSRRKIKSLRMDLANKLAHRPMLRLMLFEFRFFVAFLCFLGFLLFLALFLPKIWRSSPPGFTPIVKVSGLDLAQAWSLKRSARNSMAAQQWENAAYCWDAAIANNAADPDSLRGMLRLLIASPQVQRARGAQIPGYAHWLLRLTATNQTDLVLAVQALDAARAFDTVLNLIAATPGESPPELQAARLRALFQSGRTDEFDRSWRASPAAVQQAPAVRLCRAAWTAGWATAGATADARNDLETAATDAQWSVDASRLQLQLARRLVDLELHERAYQRLEKAGALSAEDQAGLWLLLQAAGQAERARELAGAFAETGANPQDTLTVADAQLRLSLPERARQTLHQGLQRMPGSVELWVALANLLVNERQWSELAELVWQIRASDVVHIPLQLYALYLEARAESGLGRRASADDALAKLAETPAGNTRLARMTATGLLDMEQHRLARDLLLKIEPDQQGDPSFWHALVVAAVHLKDAPLLKRAATRAYEIAPANVICRNNYAAALLIFREQPEVAVQLTFDILRANPRSPQAVLNHALALAQNYRFNEARDRIQGMTESGLGPMELQALRLCRVEIAAGAGRLEEARALAATIDRAQLMEPQRAWLERTLGGLAAVPGTQ